MRGLFVRKKGSRTSRGQSREAIVLHTWPTGEGRKQKKCTRKRLPVLERSQGFIYLCEMKFLHFLYGESEKKFDWQGVHECLFRPSLTVTRKPANV